MARHCKCLRVGWAVVLGVAASLWLRSAPARAYDEQLSVDLSAGYALLARSDWPSRQGAGVDLGASWGVTDAVTLRGTLGYAYFAQDEAYREHVGRLRAEGLYLLDVLKVVPFFGLGVTLSSAQLHASSLPLRPGAHVLVGVDYLHSRTWNFGLDVRTGLLFDGSRAWNATDVSLRVSRLFETF